MIEWLVSLDNDFAVVYFWIAAAASVFLIIQFILTLVSFGGADTDLDVDGDGLTDGLDGDVGTGIDIFTIKGLTAFFALGGWVGLLSCILLPKELSWISVFPAVLVGFGAMVGVAFLMKSMLKLQQSGNIDKKNIVGKTATVYVTVQPSYTGRGKVTMTLQGQYTELDAVTDQPAPIYNGERVVIVEYYDSTALVRRVY